MTTAVDTNVFVAFWDRDNSLNARARAAFDSALARGSLTVSAPVYAELLGLPGRTEAFLDYFFEDTGIAIDWHVDEQTWRAAGPAFQSYANRRRKQESQGPRRILVDFLIGAHALRRGHHLLTLDDRLYRTGFPRLTIIAV